MMKHQLSFGWYLSRFLLLFSALVSDQMKMYLLSGRFYPITFPVYVHSNRPESTPLLCALCLLDFCLFSYPHPYTIFLKTNQAVL